MDLRAGSDVFFTSDLHFFHKSMAARRGFSTVEEMNEALVNAWNAKVGRFDTVWVLGDISFGSAVDTKAIFHRLNGKKHLVRGNHDAKFSDTCLIEIFETVQDYKKIKFTVKKADGTDEIFRIVMCHFPILIWDQAHYGSWHLHGHSHGMCVYPNPKMRIADVGVDCVETMAPVRLDRVKEYMADKTFVSFDGHTEKAVVPTEYQPEQEP